MVEYFNKIVIDPELKPSERDEFGARIWQESAETSSKNLIIPNRVLDSVVDTVQTLLENKSDSQNKRKKRLTLLECRFLLLCVLSFMLVGSRR